MRARLLAFIAALREEGIPCSVSETLDATRAAATLGIERSVLREALAATLVKDRADRPIFDEVFARHFGTPQRTLKKPQRRAEDGEGSRGEGEGHGVRDRRRTVIARVGHSGKTKSGSRNPTPQMISPRIASSW